jgi:regulator of sirC expression with transglutaminase-like and TPR domain
MTARSEAECLAQLPEDADTDDAFAPADPGAVLLRMFNNLKYFHAGQGSFHRALDMLDCQLQVLPEDARLHFEQGELWLRLGSVDSARRAFQAAASHASRTGSGLERSWNAAERLRCARYRRCCSISRWSVLPRG